MRIIKLLMLTVGVPWATDAWTRSGIRCETGINALSRYVEESRCRHCRNACGPRTGVATIDNTIIYRSPSVRGRRHTGRWRGRVSVNCIIIIVSHYHRALLRTGLIFIIFSCKLFRTEITISGARAHTRTHGRTHT